MQTTSDACRLNLRIAAAAGLVTLGLSIGAARAATVPLYQVPVNFTAGINGANATLPGGTPVNNTFQPPDTMGAVSGSNIIEMANGYYAVYDRSGNLLQNPTSLQTFWSNTGITAAVPQPPAGGQAVVFDPRIIYDPSINRWLTTAGDANYTGQNLVDPNDPDANVTAAGSSILLAVSKTADPAQGWNAFGIDPSGSINTQWPDYDTLGVSNLGVYIGANMYSVGANSTYKGSAVVALSKAAVVANAGVTYTRFVDPTGNSTGFSPQPEVAPIGPMPENIFGTSLTGAGTAITLSQINGTANAPTFAGPFNTVTVSNKAAPVASPQQANVATPNPLPIMPDGPRISSTVAFQFPYNWAVQDVQNPTNAALDSVRWFRYNAQTNVLSGEGLITSNTVSYYDPSIAINANGTLVIGFSASGANDYVSSEAVVGQFNSSDSSIAFSNPTVLIAGGGPDTQAKNDPNDPGIRWGDYSSTVLDPSNPNAFWTFQEFANAGGTWSTQISEITVPEPGTITLAAASALLILRRRRQA